MPPITIHLPNKDRSASLPTSLPTLLYTPLGYVILELQGTINFPTPSSDAESTNATEVGRLVFPDLDASASDATTDGPWTKRVWLYVGFQRMTGSVVKLIKPLAVLRRRSPTTEEPITEADLANGPGARTEELEVVEMVMWKIVFRSRPEPVGLATD